MLSDPKRFAAPQIVDGDHGAAQFQWGDAKHGVRDDRDSRTSTHSMFCPRIRIGPGSRPAMTLTKD